MNIYFSKVIKAGERQREFNFRQHPHTDSTSYDIDVPDDKGQRIAFSMQQAANGTWQTTAQEQLPAWIQDVESSLNNAIEEHLQDTTLSKRR